MLRIDQVIIVLQELAPDRTAILNQQIPIPAERVTNQVIQECRTTIETKE